VRVVSITTGLLLLHHRKILEALRESINRYRLQLRLKSESLARANELLPTAQPTATIAQLSPKGRGWLQTIETKTSQLFFMAKQVGHGTEVKRAIIQETSRTHAGRIAVEREPTKRPSVIIYLPMSEKHLQPVGQTV